MAEPGARDSDPAERSFAELSVLYELTATLADSLDGSSGLDDFAEKLSRVLCAEIVAVFTGPDPRELSIRAAVGVRRKHYEMRIPLDLLTELRQSGPECRISFPESETTDEVETATAARAQLWRFNPRIACGAAFLLHTGRGTLGVLLVGKVDATPFARGTLGMIATMARRVSVVLHHARTRGELEANEQKYRTLMMSASDAILVYDPERDELVDYNAAAARLIGIETDVDLFASGAPLLMTHLRALGELQRDGQRTNASSLPMEWPITGPTGTLFLDAAACPVTVAGRTMLLVTARDVTRRRRMENAMIEARERAEAATRAKSAFLANMSHEIRTPLAGIIGLASILQESDLESSEQQMVATLANSAEALLRILNDVLDMSKIEAGQIEIEHTDFDLHATVADVRDLLAQMAAEKAIDIRCSIDDDVPRHVSGDPLRLRQVLLNLGSNAVKFTAEGGVHIAVRTTARTRPDRTALRVAVDDTGVGIAPEVAPQLFTAFSQADSSTARRFGGTGLGLAICKQLVQLQGGRIGFEHLSGGTRFWFELDYAVADTPRPVRAPTEAVPVPESDILIVDDNDINLRVAATILTKQGHRVVTACSAVEAFCQLESRHFDLIFMDCQMPGMDGYEATRQIREGVGDHASTPIIALTANALSGDRERCLEAGMDDFLAKPARAADFFAATQRWLTTMKASARQR